MWLEGRTMPSGAGGYLVEGCAPCVQERVAGVTGLDMIMLRCLQERVG